MTSPQTWRVNGVDLAVQVRGEGPLVVLAHGFPDLSITWRHQVPALVAAGFRVVAVDMRGYGRSARPAYALREIALDLVGLLEHEGATTAHFVGHDWGAARVWQVGVDHPEAVASLTGLSVPHVLPAPAPPTDILRARWGEQFYQIRFQEPGPSEAMLEHDVARTLAAILRDRYELIEGSEPVSPPAWLPRELFAQYVDRFRETGFAGGLGYYRNIDDNWREACTRLDHVIRRPSLFITGGEDPVTTFMRVDTTERTFADLRTVVVEGAGHWGPPAGPRHREPRAARAPPAVRGPHWRVRTSSSMNVCVGAAS
ncbi:pimeloyl-ACP methyl ester carboxylesterase [Pseudonocardia hierapolitana]|uniref:Pimeloyl-ACP methyl ester carboxylesterase n=1 Tax=Pseudonocardia hierapolitana TaxID=1128676 RepID=A0A561T018_9PSEU|nr:alpha/beta hydrolase [Pseudonocardia hierapolitana]TWF80459.1 pimeloyl-ACP methyl ester carboxylesterase [Pseudonocardia hierapolitana]